MADINIDITGKATGTTWQTKQDKTDQNIVGTEKSVVGRLNDDLASITLLSSDIDNLNNLTGVLGQDINQIKSEIILNAPDSSQTALVEIGNNTRTNVNHNLKFSGSGSPATSPVDPADSTGASYTTKAYIETYPILSTKTKADNLLQIDQYNIVSANGCLQVKNASSFASDPKDYTSKQYVDSKTSSWIPKGTSTNAKTWTWPLTINQYYRVWYNLGSSTTTDTLKVQTFQYKGSQMILDQQITLGGLLITAGVTLTAGSNSGSTITITNVGTGSLGFIAKLEESPTLALFGDPKGEPENA